MEIHNCSREPSGKLMEIPNCSREPSGKLMEIPNCSREPSGKLMEISNCSGEPSRDLMEIPNCLPGPFCRQKPQNSSRQECRDSLLPPGTPPVSILLLIRSLLSERHEL